MTTTLHDILRKATEPGEATSIPARVLRDHFETRATRRSLAATARFLALMGAGILLMNFEHVFTAAPRPGNVATVLFVLVAFPLSWLLHRRRCRSLTIQKRFQWAARTDVCNWIAVAGFAVLTGWFALDRSGVLPVPAMNSLLPWTILTVPLIAWLLSAGSKLIARRFDPDWME